MSVTEELLRPLLRESSRPIITHYDDSAGTRIELSVATLANWAAKTANWLVDEFDIEPGDAVAIQLPAHWQTAGVVLGALWCGAHIVDQPAGARVAFIAQNGNSAGAAATAIVALDPLGRGLATPPSDGALDYLTEARIAADDFAPLLPIDTTTPALGSADVADVLATARRRAAELGIALGDRVLSTQEWAVPDGLIDALLAPLSVGASIVQITNAQRELLADRRTTERTTVDLS